MPKTTVGARIEQEEKARLIDRADKLGKNVNQVLKEFIHRFNRKELNEEEIVSDKDANPSSYQKMTEEDFLKKIEELVVDNKKDSNSEKSSPSESKKDVKDMEVHEIRPEDLSKDGKKSSRSGSGKEEIKDNLKDMGFVTKDDLEDLATKEDILEAIEVKPEDLEKSESKNSKELYECSNCGYKRTGKFNKCPSCDTELEWEKKDWKENAYECNCGYMQETKFDKCPYCGTEIKEWIEED